MPQDLDTYLTGGGDPGPYVVPDDDYEDDGCPECCCSCSEDECGCGDPEGCEDCGCGLPRGEG